MKLHNPVENKAVLSNVGSINQFSIKSTAKSFSILSSGLYSNKIRAVVRELSCNAIDSHTAAGKTTLPYDVHLPNMLEPWFSIRDYGTGLGHDQVTNLYTTYFESTKTDSNAFIGALGLGSKSPFSYTDNFTVTAVKDGVRGVYTAFINEMGVPSIALMTQDATTEPTGIEVKFSVNDRNDYQKFITEAKQVYKYFTVRPIISGCDKFVFEDPKYMEKNLVLGIHRVEHNSNYGQRSVAIMGNIEYPIAIPGSEEKALGDLLLMLNCGLVIEFGIGELDFQASREGLSYVGVTLQSIKTKLTQLRDALVIKVAAEADKLDNLWDRAIYLATKMDDNLFKASVKEYLTKTGFELVKDDRYNKLQSWKFTEKTLADTYNIKLRAGNRARHENKCSTIQPTHDYHNQGGNYHTVAISENSYFVVTDTKRGAFERAKYHWRSKDIKSYQETFFVLEPADKTQPMKTAEFLWRIANPPKDKVLLSSSLDEKPKAAREKSATILVIEERRTAKRRYSYVWAPIGTLADFNDKETYYYVPLVQFQAETISTEKDIKNIYQTLKDSGTYNGNIYGIRKKEIDAVKNKKNWVHVDTLILDKLNAQSTTTAKSLAKSAIDFNDFFVDNVVKLVSDSSKFKQLYKEFEGVKEQRNDYNLQTLMRWYGVKDTKANFEAEKLSWIEKINEVKKHYPLLSKLSYTTSKTDVAEYINMIDQVKGN